MTEPTIDLKEAAVLWNSATVECRATWAKAADLPKMPSELLLIAKDPMIGQALAKWSQDICELVVDLRERLKRLDSQPVPVEPEKLTRFINCFTPLREYIDTLQSALAKATEERDTAKKNYQFMVERAADEKMDGYRELGAKCASLEIRAESAESQLAKVTEEQEIGRRWKENSSLDEWFPYTAEELRRVTNERDAAESSNKRLVELLLEPSASMIRAADGHITPYAVFVAMSAELLKEVRK